MLDEEKKGELGLGGGRSVYGCGWREGWVWKERVGVMREVCGGGICIWYLYEET